MSPPFGVTGRLVAVSSRRINADVAAVPVSLYRTMYVTCAPVPAEKVTSAASATPAADVFVPRLADVAIRAPDGMSDRNWWLARSGVYEAPATRTALMLSVSQAIDPSRNACR